MYQLMGYKRDTIGRLFDGCPLGRSAVIEASSGVARLRFTGSKDAGEVQRTFDVGGGESVVFRIADFSNVCVEILSVAADVDGGAADIRFMWSDQPWQPRLMAYRRHEALASGSHQIPRGATQVVFLSDDAAFVWINTIAGATEPLAVTAGTTYRVLGDAFTLSSNNSAIYLLEPV